MRERGSEEVGGKRSTVTLSSVSPFISSTVFTFTALLSLTPFSFSSHPFPFRLSFLLSFELFLPLRRRYTQSKRVGERESDRERERAFESIGGPRRRTPPRSDLSANLLPLPVELRHVLQLHARRSRCLDRRLGTERCASQFPHPSHHHRFFCTPFPPFFGVKAAIGNPLSKKPKLPIRFTDRSPFCNLFP